VGLDVDLLITGGMLITVDSYRGVYAGDIAVVGDRIAGIGEQADLKLAFGEPRDSLDARRRYVIPGLVNSHTHLFQSALRGFGDGLDSPTWLQNVVQPFYDHLTLDDVYWFTLLGAIENIRSGVTSVGNFHAFPNSVAACELVAEAVGRSGIRGLITKSSYGKGARDSLLSTREAAIADLRSVFANIHGMYDGRVRFCAGFPNALSATPDWIVEAHEIARSNGSGLHTHVGETKKQSAVAMSRLKMTEIAFLHDIGVLDANFLGAHAVHLTTTDLDLVQASAASLVHCPVSNMYLGSGVAAVSAMLERGINVAVGTDGPATNNNQDMFLVMRLSSLLARVVHTDPGLVPPGIALELATRNGSKAIGIDAGSLEVGKLADLVVVDLTGIHNQPLHRPVSGLINSAHSDDVESVVVGGRIVMRNRRIEDVDEEELMVEVYHRAARVWSDAGLVRDALTWPWT
jgi:5-methylthioadenosine/S-adenosylhomocysteine deaminase